LIINAGRYVARKIAGVFGSGKDEKEEKSAEEQKGQCVLNRGKETKQSAGVTSGSMSYSDPPPPYQEKAVVSSG